MRVRFNLRTRFLAWFTLLLIFVVGAILLIIEKREVATIFEESKNKGLLIAQNMADRNLQALFFFQVDAIQRSIEDQVDDKLLYVVFYDRYATPIVYNALIADRKDIFGSHHLQGDVREDGSYVEAKVLRLGGRVRSILEIEIPVFSEDPPSRWGMVKIGLSLDDMRAEIRKMRLALLLIGLGGFLFGLAGATLLARRIVRPIQTLADGTVRIAKGDFVHRIETRSRDEIGDLARSFNEMSGKLLEARERMEEAQRRLVQSEKLASIGRLAATIAHEIRNPLTSVKLNIQKVSQGETLDDVEREHMAIAQEGILLIEKFVKELLGFTRAVELQKAPFALAQILEESLKMVKDGFPEKRVFVEIKVAEGLPEVMVDGDRLRQVFVNVLRNAYEAVDEAGGRVAVQVAAVEESDGRKFRVRVSDNGGGIPEKDWENIFEPFFTTKPAGVGLGLANARKLIELHQGAIRVVKKRGPGTAFEILIPDGGAP